MATLSEFDSTVMQQQEVVPPEYTWPAEDLPSKEAETEIDLPIIDLGAFLNGTGKESDLVLVREACEKHGFFLVVNHGVEGCLLTAATTELASFFALGLKQKQQAQRKTGEVIGYASSFTSRFTSSLPWKETLTMRYREGAVCGEGNVRDYFVETYGPEFEAKGELYQEYCKAMSKVSLETMELLAASMGLKKSTFRSIYEDNDSLLRLNYYPKCLKPDQVLGTGPHFDPSSVTILQQDAIAGLQVFSDGCWWTVRPHPDALVVNIGDTFTALSNGRYKGCLHRVVVNNDKPRTSITFFLSPNMEKNLKPPQELVNEEHPRKYRDFTWGEFLHFTQNHHRPDSDTLDLFAKVNAAAAVKAPA